MGSRSKYLKEEAASGGQYISKTKEDGTEAENVFPPLENATSNGRNKVSGGSVHENQFRSTAAPLKYTSRIISTSSSTTSARSNNVSGGSEVKSEFHSTATPLKSTLSVLSTSSSTTKDADFKTKGGTETDIPSTTPPPKIYTTSESKIESSTVASPTAYTALKSETRSRTDSISRSPEVSEPRTGASEFATEVSTNETKSLRYNLPTTSSSSELRSKEQIADSTTQRLTSEPKTDSKSGKRKDKTDIELINNEVTPTIAPISFKRPYLVIDRITNGPTTRNINRTTTDRTFGPKESSSDEFKSKPTTKPTKPTSSKIASSTTASSTTLMDELKAVITNTTTINRIASTSKSDSATTELFEKESTSERPSPKDQSTLAPLPVRTSVPSYGLRTKPVSVETRKPKVPTTSRRKVPLTTVGKDIRKLLEKISQAIKTIEKEKPTVLPTSSYSTDVVNSITEPVTIKLQTNGIKTMEETVIKNVLSAQPTEATPYYEQKTETTEKSTKPPAVPPTEPDLITTPEPMSSMESVTQTPDHKQKTEITEITEKSTKSPAVQPTEPDLITTTEPMSSMESVTRTPDHEQKTEITEKYTPTIQPTEPELITTTDPLLFTERVEQITDYEQKTENTEKLTRTAVVKPTERVLITTTEPVLSAGGVEQPPHHKQKTEIIEKPARTSVVKQKEPLTITTTEPILSTQIVEQVCR